MFDVPSLPTTMSTWPSPLTSAKAALVLPLVGGLAGADGRQRDVRARKVAVARILVDVRGDARVREHDELVDAVAVEVGEVDAATSASVAGAGRRAVVRGDVLPAGTTAAVGELLRGGAAYSCRGTRRRACRRRLDVLGGGDGGAAGRSAAAAAAATAASAATARRPRSRRPRPAR